MISNVIEINNKLTKYIISSFNQNNLFINEFLLQNVVYKIKMDLGKNHLLYDNLPFYWYYYGPFSETIRQSFADVRKFLTPCRDGFLLDEAHADEFKSDITIKIPEIEDIVCDLISKGGYVYSSLDEDIYKNFAPFNMIYEFRYGIFNPTESDEFTVDGDDYVKLFNLCQREIAAIPYFHDYSIIFSGLSMQIDFLNEDNLITDNWNIIKKPIKNLWFCFAQGLRCLEHDSFYNKEVDEWNRLFQNSLVKLDNEINNFIEQTSLLIDFSKYEDLKYHEKDFLAPLINICLDED